MGQRLKVLTILAGDLGSVSSIYMVVPKKPVTQTQRPLGSTDTSTRTQYT